MIYKRTHIDMTPEALREAQQASLESVSRFTAVRIDEWIESYIDVFGEYRDPKPRLAVSYSGGLDSSVLLHFVRTLHPHRDIPAVFVDTGLEFPEVRAHALAQDNVIVIRPEMHFRQVIERYGYPVVSKQTARGLYDLRHPTENNEATRHLRRTGRTLGEDKPVPSMKVPDKWQYLEHAPFDISDKCCEYLKERPMDRAWKELNLFPLSAVRAEESDRRTRNFLRNGCTVNRGSAQDLRMGSAPLWFWSHQHILEYIVRHDVAYPSVYGKIRRDSEGKFYTTGEQRTGCSWCAFGAQHDGFPNRYQRMERTHPKLHRHVLQNLGFQRVLEHLNIPHSNPQMDLFGGNLDERADMHLGEEGVQPCPTCGVNPIAVECGEDECSACLTARLGGMAAWADCAETDPPDVRAA